MKKWKKFLNKFSISLFVGFVFPSLAFAEEETENVSSALKSSSYEPNFFSIILSLILVVALIYVTGILYTKLNKLGLHTIKKELKGDSDIKPIIVSTTPVGSDKNLQVIEVAGQRLLIGVANNSVNLIKDLGKIGSSQNSENYEKSQTEESKPKEKIEIQQNIEENNSTEQEDHSVNPEDFGLYKKYLR